MWVIKNKKYDNYYAGTICNNQYHFVKDIMEAKKMDKTQCKKIIEKFNAKDNYEMVRVSK